MAPWHLVSTGQNRSSHAARFDLKVSPCITTAVEQQQQMRTSWINCCRDWISWLRLCLTWTKRLSINNSQPFSVPLNDRLSNLNLSSVLKRFSVPLSCSNNSANKFPEKFFQTFIIPLSIYREAALISIRQLLSIRKTTITSAKIWSWFNHITPGRIRNPFPTFGPTQMGLGQPLGPRLVKLMASEDVSLQAWRALISSERSWEMVIPWIVIADRFRLQVRSTAWYF